MTQEEFDRVIAVAKEKHHCDDIVFRVGLLLDAVEFERERCAVVAEKMKLTGGFLAGETPGPLFDAGWNGCASETAKFIRGSQAKDTSND